MTTVLAQFLRDVHKHPLFSLIVAVVLGSFITFSFNYFAIATEQESLRKEVIDNREGIRAVTISIEQSKLETRIHSLESEIFSLERLVVQDEARDTDFNRLAKLRSELGTAKRDLNRLDL